MIPDSIITTANDDVTELKLTKMVQGETRAIFANKSAPFGTAEELEIAHQTTKSNRKETLVSAKFSTIGDPCDASSVNYVRVFIKIDRPPILNTDEETQLNEALNVITKIMDKSVYTVSRIIDGEV